MTESTVLHWKQQFVNAFLGNFCCFLVVHNHRDHIAADDLADCSGFVWTDIVSLHFDGRCKQLRLFLELRTRGQVETYHTEDAVDFLAVNLSLMLNAFVSNLE